MQRIRLVVDSENMRIADCIREISGGPVESDVAALARRLDCELPG